MLSVDELTMTLGTHSKKTKLYNAGMKAVHLKITGKVQGVCFRAETKRVADMLEVTGWVRNCDDGSVEVFAEGEENALRKLEEWCTHGPAMARVQRVTKKETFPENRSSFEIPY